MSEIQSKEEIGMSDLFNSSPKQLNRRELGKVVVAGALGATQLGWSRSAFAQEGPWKRFGAQSSGTKPEIKLICLCPANATDEDLLFYKQVGVDGVHLDGASSPGREIGEITPGQEGGVPSEDYTVENLQRLKKRFADAGFYTEIPFPGHVSNYEDIVLNRPGRDKAIEDYKAGIRLMAAGGYDYIPTTFNVTVAAVSGQAVVRGSHARDFDLNSPELGGTYGRGLGSKRASANSLLFGREYTKEEMWENYTYFIKQIVPVLEETGVRIGFHPDDPPCQSLFGVARIFSSLENYKQLLAIANSPNVGVLLCCGTWAEGGAAMGTDPEGAIRYFGPRKQLFEIHFRSVTSPLPHFNETYPDAGYYDMYKIMKPLVDVKYNGVVQLDHTVAMVGGLHTYQAFALGYMRALLQRAQREDGA